MEISKKKKIPENALSVSFPLSLVHLLHKVIVNGTFQHFLPEPPERMHRGIAESIRIYSMCVCVCVCVCLCVCVRACERVFSHYTWNRNFSELLPEPPERMHRIIAESRIGGKSISSLLVLLSEILKIQCPSLRVYKTRLGQRLCRISGQTLNPVT